MSTLPLVPPITPCCACGATPEPRWRVTAAGDTFVWRMVHECATPWHYNEAEAVVDWNASQARQQEAPDA